MTPMRVHWAPKRAPSIIKTCARVVFGENSHHMENELYDILLLEATQGWSLASRSCRGAAILATTLILLRFLSLYLFIICICWKISASANVSCLLSSLLCFCHSSASFHAILAHPHFPRERFIIVSVLYILIYWHSNCYLQNFYNFGRNWHHDEQCWRKAPKTLVSVLTVS
jgi:hypothetical protein